MTSADFTPKYKRGCLLPIGGLAAGASVLPSAWGTLTSSEQDAEAKVEPTTLKATSPENVSLVGLVRRDDHVAGTRMSNRLVTASRNFWSNSIPETKLQHWRPGSCCYRYKIAGGTGTEIAECGCR